MVVCSSLWTKASHLVGGEITYKHVINNTYNVFVTLYRDCDDCKIGGTGGGSSTSNCSDLDEVYIRTLSQNCGNKNVGTISLDKLGFEDITQICTTSKSKCKSGSTYSYGFEAHHYKGTVNFNNYTTYSGCAFQIFFHKSERNSSMNTFTTEEDDIYNYVYINPWLEKHDSPKLLSNPKVVFTQNQPTFLNEYNGDSTNDSLSFKWKTPLKAYNTKLLYKSGYNQSNFLTTHCNGCTPNPVAYPPKGLYLNSDIGNIVLTPTSANQISTRVLSIERWRKINGTFKLLSEVRRDLLTIVKADNANNNPIINAQNQYFVCIGDTLDINISATDIARTVAGTKLPNDSVKFEVIHSLSNRFQSTKKSSGIAPYQELNLFYTPNNQDTGRHTILIKAIDNNCPEIGYSLKAITIIVKPAPEIDFTITEKFCGTNQIDLIQNQEGNLGLTVSNSDKQIYINNSFQSGDNFQHYITEDLTFKLSITDIFGCTATANKTIRNLGSTSVRKATLIGDTIACSNESLELYLNHPKFQITKTVWNYGGLTLNTDTFKELATNGNVSLNYTLTKDEINCELGMRVNLKALAAPTLQVDVSQNVCYRKSIDLAFLNAKPLNGTWNYEKRTIPNNKLELKSNADQSINLTYAATNTNNCISDTLISLDILKSPEMQLTEESICGDQFAYNLKNAIIKPYHYSIQDIDWKIINQPGALIGTHPFAQLDIPTFGTGLYYVEAVNNYINGCSSSDTTLISVSLGLKLTTNGKTTICQQGEKVNLESHLNLNAKGGGWNSINAGEHLDMNFFTPIECGDYSFNYTYDKNGCFDQIDVPLRVICKPQFNTILPDSICSDYAEINLENQGTWKGEGVTNYTFSPDNILGVTYLRQTKSSANCIFDTVQTITVIEPLDFEILNIPDKICEKEILKLEISKPSFSILNIKSCENTFENVKSIFDYTPTLCDLNSKKIRLEATLTSNAVCNNNNQSFSIDYFKTPKIKKLNQIENCNPYSYLKKIKLITSTSAAITHTIYKNGVDLITGSNEINYNFNSEGSYGLKINIIDKNGCKNDIKNTAFFKIYETPVSQFSIGNGTKTTLSDRNLYLNNASYIDKGELTYKWSWSKNHKTNHFSIYTNPIYKLPADTGLFSINLEAISSNKCADTSNQNIYVVPDVLIFIPSAFTPDNKGPESNATFSVVSSNVQSYHISIFNKWGQIVYESYDINDSWDGDYMSKACQNGVYMYSIKMVNKSGLEYAFQGTVNLIR